MRTTGFHLRNAPIVEAVLDIECDFASSYDFMALETRFKESLIGNYPKFQRRFSGEFQIKSEADALQSASMSQRIEAFLFSHADGKQMVQARRSGFSFNRLAPYDGLDTYLDEIKSRWEIYRQIANPNTLRSIQLRYINRMLLPANGGKIDLGKYLKDAPKFPVEEGFTPTGFLNQRTAIEHGSGHTVEIVLTMHQVQTEQLPVILDITAAASIDASPFDWTLMNSTLEQLRTLKNKVFWDMVTPECLHLYQ